MENALHSSFYFRQLLVVGKVIQGVFKPIIKVFCVISCYLLLSVGICCYQLLSVVICCYQLVFVVICCYQLVFVVISCYLLLSVVICCYPLLFVVISTIISTLRGIRILSNT